MDLIDAIYARHSVRAYTGQTVGGAIRLQLEALAQELSRAGGLTLSFRWDEPRAFSSPLAHYGKFSQVTNYLVISGRRRKGLEQDAGYYGERIVLEAQRLGLNSCWVATTAKRRLVRASIPEGESLVILVAIGHGENAGVVRRSKVASQVSNVGADTPPWFARAVEAALLAPTSINQQKFHLAFCAGDPGELPGVRLTRRFGPYSSVDEGIVRLHVEIAARDAAGLGPHELPFHWIER
ncbi:nitroreductase family protein [Collinsella vaginalis]|uniref:nitroreductase family protein n=1 Tax=Collinsella vaginalis TaxID=1870987 RepID=UPI000A267909|nr:nitroreductase family protein [Collinsella vaginalis]